MPKKPVKGQQRYKQVILAGAIAILVVSFVLYGISVVYEGPKYENYCNDTIYNRGYGDVANCEAVGGRWNENVGPKPVCAVGQECPTGYCDSTYACRSEFDKVRIAYERNVFFIGAIIGLIVLILGFILQLASVSAGISIGGVAIMFFSIVRYWNELNKYVRLVLLGIILAILVWFGYKRLKK